jgi:hypothetical protein
MNRALAVSFLVLAKLCGEEQPANEQTPAQSQPTQPATPQQAAPQPATPQGQAQPGTPQGQAQPGTPAANPTPSAGLQGSIQIEVLDQQLFHANTPRRLLLDPRNTQQRTTERGGGFAFGFVIAARNDSSYLLAAPRIISDIRLQGEHGVAPCRVVPRRSYWGYTSTSFTVVSPQRSDRTPWADEARDAFESLWRPQETVRIRAVLECGPVQLQDINPQHITGSFQVVARAPFVPHEVDCVREQEVCDDDVVGTSPPMAASGHTLALATAQIPNGPTGYVAGDIFIHAVEGRVEHRPLAELGHSLFSVSVGELPAAPPAMRDAVDEWSLTLGGVQMQHWVDVIDAPKGTRVVTVQAALAIDSASIQGRLSATLEAARTANQSAQQALASAQAAAAAAPEDPAAATALSDAERAARDASSALGRAESTYQRALGTERTRLARLLACDRVDLVTHFRTVRAANGRDAAAQCSVLSTGDAAQVTWRYVIGRYEVPVGITYAANRAQRTAFFASRPLATFDPR